MNSIHPTGEVPCPLEGRRTPRELYVKLCVVHFTVLTAYAHLMHLRREPRAWLTYPLMLISPLGGVMSLAVLPLAALAIQAIRFRFDGAILAQSVGVLFGRIEPHHDSQPAPALPQATSKWPPKLSYKVLRRVALLLALLAQCLASVWLFARRVARGSDAQYDYRVLQLAALGICVALASIIQLVFRPVHPRLQRYPRQLAWLLWVRPMLPVKYVPGSKNLYLAYIATYWAFAGLAQFGADFFHWSRNMINWVQLTSRVSRGVMADTAHFFLWTLLPLGLIGLTSIYARSLLLARLGLLMIAGGLVVWVLIVPFTMTLTAIANGPFFNSAQLVWLFQKDPHHMHYQQWTNCPESTEVIRVEGPDFDRIEAYGLAPTFCPCPKAWKDESEDYVWWLA